MKRLTLALATIGLTAASFNASAEINISIPQLQGGLIAGITGLYVEPGSSHGDLDYVSVNNNSTSANPQLQAKAVEPGFDFGWGANLGYMFANTGNDVNLSYWHLNTSDSDSTNAPAGGSLNSINSPLIVKALQLSGITFFNTQASAKADFRFNQVDLAAGQYINVGSRLQLHPFIGLRYADVKRTLNSNYAGFSPSASSNGGTFTSASGTATATLTSTFSTSGLITNEAVTETSDFDGIGPMAGMNFDLPITGGLGLQGGFSGALLAGDVDSKLQAVASVNGGSISQSPPPVINITFVPGSAQFNFSSESRRIVPNLDANLGAYYRFTFENQSDVTLGVNYQVAEYWNALDRLKTNVNIVYPTDNQIQVPIFSVGPLTHQTANAFVQGVAVSLTYHAAPTV